MFRAYFSAVLLLLMASLFAVHSPAAQTKEQPKKEESKKDIADNVLDGVVDLYKKTLEPDLNVTVKSWSVVETTPWPKRKGKHIRLLVEFMSDIEKDAWETRHRAISKVPPYADFYFFDDENVRIASERFDFRLGHSGDVNQFTLSGLIDGQISFKKGEAFRVFVPVDHLLYSYNQLKGKAKRVEVHIRMPPKEKEKKS
jgi:hypothetical protein